MLQSLPLQILLGTNYGRKSRNYCRSQCSKCTPILPFTDPQHLFKSIKKRYILTPEPLRARICLFMLLPNHVSVNSIPSPDKCVSLREIISGFCECNNNLWSSQFVEVHPVIYSRYYIPVNKRQTGCHFLGVGQQLLSVSMLRHSAGLLQVLLPQVCLVWWASCFPTHTNPFQLKRKHFKVWFHDPIRVWFSRLDKHIFWTLGCISGFVSHGALPPFLSLKQKPLLLHHGPVLWLTITAIFKHFFTFLG